MEELKKCFYHVYTKGLKDDVIFRKRSDFVIGMNYVPVALHTVNASLLAFVLMSNHFHFVLYGCYYDVTRFLNMYKRLVSRYISLVYGESKLLRAVPTGSSEISLDNDGLKKTIAYVLNNPVKAGVNCMPQNYEWGSGAYYYTNQDVFADSFPLSDMTERRRSRFLRSSIKINPDFRVGNAGYVIPASYVDVRYVERLYGGVRSMTYFLSMTSRTDQEKSKSVVFSDTIVLSAFKEILEKRYEVEDIDELSYDVRFKILVDLKRQFNSPPKQLARVTGCSLKEIASAISQ